MQILFVCIIAILIILLYRQNKKQQEILSINHSREEYNNRLEQNIIQLETQQNKIEQEFKAKTAQLSKLTSSVDVTAREYENIARKRAEDEYRDRIASLELDYQTRNSELEEKIRQTLLDYKTMQTKLKDLQTKQLTYIYR